GNKYDYYLARAWNRGRLHQPVHSYQSTIVNHGTINSVGPIGTMAGKMFNTGST
ncbi:4072_t:CDS:1, partial [Gigaspora margarita]